MKFRDYWPVYAPLWWQVAKEARDVDLSDDDFVAVEAMLAPLRAKRDGGLFHYYHSLRVGLLCARIGRCFTTAESIFDSRALLLAGLLHDIGKALVPMCTLCATEKWTEEDRIAMEPHVMDGFRMLRDRFDFTAHVIARHHRNQSGGYPKELPAPTQPFSQATINKIDAHARLLTIADVFDAMHRINSGTDGRALTDAEIEERMQRVDPYVPLLYERGVFYSE